MTDNELRRLEREAAANPADEDLQIRLFTAKLRASSPNIKSSWKIKNKNGQYISRTERRWQQGGLGAAPHGGRYVEELVFAKKGKEWDSKEDLYKFLKTFTKTGLAKQLDGCELIEYRTMRMECSRSLVTEELNNVELELLRAQKEASLKKLKILEEKEKKLLEER